MYIFLNALFSRKGNVQKVAHNALKRLELFSSFPESYENLLKKIQYANNKGTYVQYCSIITIGNHCSKKCTNL